MPKSQTKRAIQARRYRVEARGKRRFNTVVTEYVRLKHEGIYKECSEFYDSVVEKYSLNQNLVKTTEFREFMWGYVQNDNETCEDEPAVSTVEEDINEPAVSTAEEDINEPAVSTTEEDINGPTGSRFETGSEASETNNNEEHLSIAESYIEEGLMINRYVVEASNDVDPLSSIIRDTIGDIDVNHSMHNAENLQNIVDKIINNLEEVEPNIFEQPEQQVEDEGVVLNFEDELEHELFDFNIDEDLYNVF